MKTLAELIKARIPIDPDDGTAVVRYASDDLGSGYAVWGNPDDVVAGIVGAVQEWLSQDEMGDLLDSENLYFESNQRDLIREAGRGLDAEPVIGLCGNREPHKPHMHSALVGTFWCDADQSKRLPYAAEKRRAETLND